MTDIERTAFPPFACVTARYAAGRRGVRWLAAALLLLLAPAGHGGAHPDARPSEAAGDDGRIVWLATEAGEFPALYAIGGAEREGAVLLLHDVDSYADAPLLIRPLRQGLPERGWDTLSLRLPAASAADVRRKHRGLLALFAQRLQAGVEFLERQGYRSIAVVGHGFGGFAAVLRLADESPGSVHALVGINLAWYGYPEGERALLEALLRFQVSVLDLYSERGRSDTTVSAPKRKRALQKVAARDADRSRQVSLPYYDHWMRKGEAAMVRIVGNWLAGVAEPPPPAERLPAAAAPAAD